MKKSFTLILLIGLCGTVKTVRAQNETAEIIKSGITNAELLAKAYSQPLSKAFGTDINTGWITTGKAFKPGRFEIRVFANAAFVPEKDRTFDVSTIGLNSNVRLAPGSSKLAPTVFGDDSPGPLLNVYATRPDTKQEEQVTSFNTPEGIGTGIAPIPMAQVTVGLVKETELMVRFIPKSKAGDFNVDLWGVGLKHSIRQWIPGIADLPFDITAAAAYSSFRSSYQLEVNPQSGVVNPNPADYTNQRIIFDTKAFIGQLVASKTISVITGYASFSYSSASTTTGMLGNYPITVLREQPPYTRQVQNVTDPVNFITDYTQLGITGGFRLKLAIFTLNAEGTWAKYPTVSAGIGLGYN
ncbi:DUF6588 family protein [Adhaeribacter pallidiroseus]|uniref:Uncharacterized protein n=1 Tax=Adhaeribacter pallidiroseus TaxID=2072847 RepID=A0A369QA31_9BACT|nr:DUF6588 family protein [Adhaeribacter pallidiroseus]RDC61544.1 hypothetical protein AHMF7616_00123 [Adhaeribacter pallidiroseus]